MEEQFKDISLERSIKELEESLIKDKQDKPYRAILEKVERPLIEAALERTFGNQLKAAKLLGINRNTLRAKIKRLGIEVKKWKL